MSFSVKRSKLRVASVVQWRTMSYAISIKHVFVCWRIEEIEKIVRQKRRVKTRLHALKIDHICAHVDDAHAFIEKDLYHPWQYYKLCLDVSIAQVQWCRTLIFFMCCARDTMCLYVCWHCVSMCICPDDATNKCNCEQKCSEHIQP